MNGNVGIHTTVPRYPLDMNLFTPNHPTAQFGYFGIQSHSSTNGFLTANGYWNGTAMKSYYAGSIALLQFIGGKVFFRTTPYMAAGARTTTLFNNIVADNDGAAPRVGIDEVFPTHTLHVKGDALKTLGGASWSVPSDINLKNNVHDFNDGLTEVMQIRPVSFEYNGKGGTTAGEKGVGIIAQEIQQVTPYMVNEFTFRKTEGNPTDFNTGRSGPGEKYLTSNSNALPFILVNAIKEQQAQIESLQQENQEIR